MLKKRFKTAILFSIFYIISIILAFFYNSGINSLHISYSTSIILEIMFLLVIGIIITFALYELNKIIKIPIKIFIFFIVIFNLLVITQVLVLTFVFHSQFLKSNYSYFLDLDILAFAILCIFLFKIMAKLNIKMLDGIKYISDKKKDIFFIIYLICLIFNLCILSIVFNKDSNVVTKYYGWQYLIFILFIAIFTDSSGLLFGMWIGKHQLSKYSPNKTIEGAISSSIFTTIILTGLFSLCYFLWNNLFLLHLFFIYPTFDYWIIIQFFGITLFLNIISQYGDIFFSMFKRELNVKDYGSIMPYHGGVLDRIDGVIFITIFLFLIISIIK